MGKYGSVDWREDCSRCTNCVKPRCVYDVYKKEAAYNRDPVRPVVPLYECKACLSCVQGCTKGLLSIALNPEYLAMGDEYWRPDIIATTWNQADTGRIPVSGAGYRGPFYGPGFDSIWTDMSEIVRPTRDGIHGREYISTIVDIGPKPMRLSFSPDGSDAADALAPDRNARFPVILDVPPWPVRGASLPRRARWRARQLRTLARGAGRRGAPIAAASSIVCRSSCRSIGADGLPEPASSCRRCGWSRLPTAREVLVLAAEVQDGRTRQLIVWPPALPLDRRRGRSHRSSCAGEGVKVFHLCADLHGRERRMPPTGRHIKDALREIHGRLVKEGMRDEVTLIVGGGIALAEHMAKAIICGADLVAVDAPLLVALGCRVCRDMQSGVHCEPARPRSTGRSRLRRAADGEPDGRLALAADRGAGRDGHSRGAAPARRSGPRHVPGRHREGGVR